MSLGCMVDFTVIQKKLKIRKTMPSIDMNVLTAERNSVFLPGLSVTDSFIQGKSPFLARSVTNNSLRNVTCSVTLDFANRNLTFRKIKLDHLEMNVPTAERNLLLKFIFGAMNAFTQGNSPSLARFATHHLN